MTRKIVFLLIVFLILITGGFFLKGSEIFSSNLFLASPEGIFSFGKEQKKEFSLSEEEFSALTQKIAFLEKQLKEKEREIEKLDDLTKKFEILSKKIRKLEATVHNVGRKKLIEEIEVEKIKENEELKRKEAEKEKKTKEEEKTCQPKSININSALAKDLEKIIGIGPGIAQKIIEARPFYSLKDLLKVKGIGEVTLQKIIDQGCAYVDESYSHFVNPLVSGDGPAPKPKINLFFPSEIPVNKGIEIELSVWNLKEATYDVKISIEAEGIVLSEIYNQKENKWQLSFYYLKELFSGHSFSGKFQLRIKEEMRDFRGEADVFAKIRESDNKKIVSEFRGKINIIEPGLKEEGTAREENDNKINSTQAQTEIRQPKNLLLNLSFEEGDLDFPWGIASWEKVGLVATSSLIARSTAFAYSGISSVKFTDLTSAYGGRGILSDPVSVMPGYQYTFGGWIYVPAKLAPATSSEVMIRFQIQWFNADGIKLREYPEKGIALTVYDRWEKRELVDTAPDGGVMARLLIQAYEKENRQHDLYIDDTFLF